ncbi:MAG: RtcB family protein [Candidatus Hinthialibacter antarcticus]|nr:RtcB family protein [Candidatus Hinthialibacter antarcticus]
MKLDPTDGIPIQYFLDEVESGARDQAEWCAKLPGAFHHIALMPDAHQGYAMPVGGVMALKGAVMPNAVGVDIGCGMVAARTNIKFWDVRNDIQQAADEIFYDIPTGKKWHEQPQEGEVIERIRVKGKAKRDLKEYMPVVAERIDEIPFQLGTLGGGNHFIEIQKDEDGWLWVMLHSGSRNIGYTIANHYHKLAKDYCKSQDSSLPKDYAMLPLGLPEAQEYLDQMQWAMDFAMQNRLHMLDASFEIMEAIFSRPIECTLEVCTHHNYAAWETHFGEKVLVHRKGAVRALEGELVTIPGSMGTCSYIGRGKGFADSFRSCSHGAGRCKSRTQAREEISEESFAEQVKNVHIAAPSMKRIIDEAPAAYKDIEDVMKKQQHLVEPAFRLAPLAVVKG